MKENDKCMDNFKVQQLTIRQKLRNNIWLSESNLKLLSFKAIDADVFFALKSR